MKESSYNIWLKHNEVWYVFNGISGALLSLSEQEYSGFRQYMAGEIDISCSFDVLERLATARIFIPDDADELTFLKKRYDFSRGDSEHFGLTIVTSLGCNFDCPYCFEAKHPSIIDDEVERCILEVVDDQVPKIRSLSVTWFGGEPLVGKQPLLTLSDALIQRCEKSNVRYTASIVTNGYLLTEQTCIELRDRRVTAAQIGLDGPPSIHDQMRPLAGGKGSFWRIVENIHHAIKYMNVSIRVNIDKGNCSKAEELLQILAAEGLAGEITVYPAQITHSDGPGLTPLLPYSVSCFSNGEFAHAETDFERMAQHYGFSTATLPSPTGAPCTAVRANDLVIGSAGELYKCWHSVGNQMEVIGTVKDYSNPNGRLQKWLKYSPFENSECRTCIALPVCMGGCASHAMSPAQYENRCGTFRHNYLETLQNFISSRQDQGFSAFVPVQALVRRTETR
jgi:uncharacterized protein